MGVPFKLTVGGTEHKFDGAQVRLGRTSDNEMVVLDPAASRTHAVITAEGSRFTIEDLKSGNGTKLNGVRLSVVQPLVNGDIITIGDTNYVFTCETPVDNNSTMIGVPSGISDSETVLKNPPPEATQPPTADPNATMLKPLTADSTGPVPRLPEEPAQDPNATLLKALPPAAPAGVHDATAEIPPLPVRSAPNDVANLETREVERDAMTAADKLRERRQAYQGGTVSRLRYEWKQLPLGMRRAFVAVSSISVLATLAIVGVSMIPKQSNKPPEPIELAVGTTVEASFGLGDGVTYARRDMKVFTFDAKGATKIIGLLHYFAGDISKDEVSLTLNGFDLGFVPPDTMDVGNRELEVVLPADQVKRDQTNQVIFDNVKNPPGDEPWRVWNVRLELIAIPDLSTEETLGLINEHLERGRTAFEQREIGPENLFKSWKEFRDAWLLLEALTQRPDAVYIEARTRQRETLQMLDQQCSTMQLEVLKLMSAKRPDYELARETLNHALEYFPTREHRCHDLARALLEDVGGPK